jgi:hypothetical protein
MMETRSGLNQGGQDRIEAGASRREALYNSELAINGARQRTKWTLPRMRPERRYNRLFQQLRQQ